MKEIQWWCAAQGIPWTWSWQPYPGVWLAALALFTAYTVILRRSPYARERRNLVIAGYIGVFIVWLSLDWPIGPLGVGYLAFAHSLKFLLISFVATPLMWLPFSPKRSDPATWGGQGATSALLAGVFFNVVLILSHTPLVVDGLAESQLWSFVLDSLWLVAGVLFWRPIVGRNGLPQSMVKVLYIFLGTLSHTGLGMFFLLSRYPHYRVFELAPRVEHLSARVDQALAGALMLLAGTPIVFLILGIVFSQVARAEQAPGVTVR